MQTWAHIIATVVILGILALFTWPITLDSRRFFGLPLLAQLSVYAALVQIIAFIPSFICQSEKFYDIVGSFTYISITLIATFTNIPGIQAKQIVAACMVVVWSGRLGFFLFRRVLRAGQDTRFKDIKPFFLKYLNTWLLQALWVILTMAPLLVVMTDANIASKADFIWVDWLGIGIWVLGFVFEVVADCQKSYFNDNPQNRGRYINVGLWSISRHPNYFGEIVIWIGAAVYSISVLRDFQFFSLISPVFVYCLLRFVSGVPLLEEKADKKWGHEEAYRKYRMEVAVLVPFFTCCEKDLDPNNTDLGVV